MTSPTQKPREPVVQQVMPQLLGLSLVKVNFEIAMDSSLADLATHPIDMAFGVACRRTPGGSARNVFVEASLNAADPQKPAAYTGKVIAVAQLGNFTPGLSAEQIDDQAANYGAPIAYCMVRDEFLRLTGMTPANRMLLPMMARDVLLKGVAYQDEDGRAIVKPSP